MVLSAVVLGTVLPWFVVVGVVFSIVVLGSVSVLDGPGCCVPETLYYGVLCSMLWCCSVVECCDTAGCWASSMCNITDIPVYN